jgi:nifR3 family TIM-barrel protein
MSSGFWQKLARPFTVLAPMSGYTDAAYRRIVAKYGKPDVMCTEFVPAEGICSRGRDNMLPLLWITSAERPVVAQVYGGNPDQHYQAAQFIAGLGFDGIDINMGCPARTVESRFGGSALIRDPARAKRIVEAVKAGAGNVPVSVKTRIGYNINEIDSWLAALLESRPAAITLHARTREEAYNIPARWDVIQRAVALAREIEPCCERRPLIIGNGDVRSLAEAYARAGESGCDGVMIGRGAWGNPWLFSRGLTRDELPLDQVLDVVLEHTRLYYQLYGAAIPLEPMRKHFKAYISGFDGARELKTQLMHARNYEHLESIALSATAE